MISVLHIYPKNDSMLSNYVGKLSQAMENYVDARHTDDMATARQMIAESSPQIIHLHATATTPHAVTTSRVVLSAHGTTDHPARGSAYVCIARSTIEANRLSHAGVPRIETIRNPIFTKSISFSQVAEQMNAIYQKVMDSNVLPLLTDDTRLMLACLLKAALCGDRRWTGSQPLPDDVQWRQLFIYADCEGLTDVVEKGIGLLGLQPPPHPHVDSYLPAGYTRPQATRTRRTDVIALMKNIRLQMGQQRLSLLSLCELHQALRQPSLDEAELMANLEAGHLTPLFRSTLQILKEQLLLDEGFMPCPPSNDQTTKKIRTTLNRHLQL